jgi:photosystem II stability/assembly factor-like uncharacterized protein
MAIDFTPAKSGFSRVFLIDGRARPDHAPEYQSCLMAGTPEQTFGDVERIECPAPDAYGQFDEVGRIQGAIERATFNLTGRYAADVASALLEIARRRCPADVQVHFGACTDPRIFNTFTKNVIIEDAILTNWSTDTDMGSLSSDENSPVSETADVSAQEFYEVLPITFALRGADVVTNPLVDVVFCSVVSCGDCEDEDQGCDIIYAVGDSSPGSPGTAPDVIYSTDEGATLAADEITTLTNVQNADAVACLGDYVLVVSNDEAFLHYKLKATINAGTAGGWTEIATGFVGANNPKDMWSVGNYVFIVGDNGYVYGTADATVGVTVLDAGVATTEDLLAVHALNDDFAVAVGANGAIVATENQTVWRLIDPPTGISDDFLCVWVKNKNEWWIGSDAGNVYYTLDGGTNWTAKALPVTLSAVYDLAFATESVAYLSGQTATPAGRFLRSYNGGYDWVVLPEGAAALPASDNVAALAACVHDANFAVGVGLADDAADGVFMVGRD